MMIIDSFSGKYEFLSNFYYSPIVLDNIEYPTVEHAYQCQKTFNHLERTKILYLLDGKFTPPLLEVIKGLAIVPVIFPNSSTNKV